MRSIAFIPARIGSQRLKYKNLALINGKPLIAYAIDAAKKSKKFSKIVLNSDHEIFKKIAERYKIDFYLRPKKLGKNNIKSDDVLYDFIKHYPNYEYVCWVNPIAPLLTSLDISEILNYFKKHKLDSLITVENKKVHCLKEKIPINYIVKSKFEQTQNLIPIKTFVYSLMMWKVNTFINSYKKKKFGFFCGKFGTYALNPEKNVIIKTKSDLFLAEKILKLRNNDTNLKIKYDKVLKTV